MSTSGATPPNVVAHPALLAAQLEQAEEALYTDAQRAEELARGVAVATRDRPRGDRARIRAETLLVILDAQGGRCVEAIHTALHLADEATTANHDDLAARLQNVIGAAYDLLELPERAVRHYGRCLALAQVVGARDVECKAETNLGVAWSRMGDDVQALLHFRRALELARGAGSAARQGRLYLDLSISHRKLGDLDGAARALQQARRCIEQTGHRRSLPQLALQEGLLLVEEGDTAGALARIRDAEGVAEAERLPHVVALARVALAKALREAAPPHRDVQGAAEKARGAVEAAREQESDAVTCAALEELSRSLEAAGRLSEALAAHRDLLDRRAAGWRRRDESNAAALRVAHEVEALRAEREALRTTNQRLRALNQEKAEILAIVGHDLRSPLTLVTMVSDQLQDPGAGIEPGRAGAILESCAERMVGVLDRLLTTDALERGALVPRSQPVDLAAAVARAISGLELRALHKDVVLRHEGDRVAWVRGDPSGVDQIVYNLIDNAVKFSGRGGEVVARVAAADGWIELAVLDRGPGFTDADLASAFGKFARLSARPTGGEASHGLGLYVVRRMAEELGGTASAANRPDGGAALRVRLPRQR